MAKKSLMASNKKEDKDEVERETWGGKFDFFLSALGYAGENLLKELFAEFLNFRSQNQT